MEFIELQAFVAVARERSFSRAAVRLFRTQPAVSLAIKRLEDDVGRQLFTRTSRSAALTDAGEVLLDYASRLCALRDEAQRAMATLPSDRPGDVTIGANETLVAVLLPAIGAHQHAVPSSRVDVRPLHARDITASVRLGELDLGVLGFRPDDPAIEAVPIGTDEVVVLVPPTHRLADAASVRLQDIAQETFVGHGARSWTRDRIEALFERAGFRPRIGIVLPTLDTVKGAVERGLGVTAALRSAACSDVASGRLAAVRLDEAGLTRQIWLVFDRTRPQSAAARRFLDVARHSFGSPGGVIAFDGGEARDTRRAARVARRAASSS